MNKRIREVREHFNLTQTQFGEALGASRDEISNIEYGRLKNPERKEPIIQLICTKFGVSEAWLRNGTGEMFEPKDRAQELDDFVNEVLHDRPESFRAALVSTLMHFKPEEWFILENIYQKIKDEMEQKKETDG